MEYQSNVSDAKLQCHACSPPSSHAHLHVQSRGRQTAVHHTQLGHGALLGTPNEACTSTQCIVAQLAVVAEVQDCQAWGLQSRAAGEGRVAACLVLHVGVRLLQRTCSWEQKEHWCCLTSPAPDVAVAIDTYFWWQLGECVRRPSGSTAVFIIADSEQGALENKELGEAHPFTTSSWTWHTSCVLKALCLELEQIIISTQTCQCQVGTVQNKSGPQQKHLMHPASLSRLSIAPANPPQNPMYPQMPSTPP
eukprot:1136650-Pelagomonas_calceolata.AAC.2